MPYGYDLKRLTLGTPAVYRIDVKGRLDESWSDRLGGMTIKTNNCGDEAHVTTLTGPMRDQAELMGVLNSLYELHLPIVSVEVMDMEKSNSSVT